MVLKERFRTGYFLRVWGGNTSFSTHICAQDLSGKVIHDDAAGTHARPSRGDFISMWHVEGGVLYGVTGGEELVLGKIQDGSDVLSNVAYTPQLNYGIDSKYRMIEEEGWRLVLSPDPRSYTYVRLRNGQWEQRVYSRGPTDTHYVRLHSTEVVVTADEVERVCRKMDFIHDAMAHTPKTEMLKMTYYVSESILGYTREEATIYLRYGVDCDACTEGRATARKTIKSNRLIYSDYRLFGKKEGVHTDIFHINNLLAFLYAKSHKYGLHWVRRLSPNYDGDEIKINFQSIFGDYRYAKRDIHFVRSDGESVFTCLSRWLALQGLRHYIAPTGLHTTRAEKGGRDMKDMVRVLVRSLQFLMPMTSDWLWFAIFEASNLLSMRPKESLGWKTPLEFFFDESHRYDRASHISFGSILSYPFLEADKSMSSNVGYGVVVGRETTTGNLFVEQFLDKQVVKIPSYFAILSVDTAVQQYFEVYSSVPGFDYKPGRSTLISTCSTALNQGCRNLEFQSIRSCCADAGSESGITIVTASPTRSDTDVDQKCPDLALSSLWSYRVDSESGSQMTAPSPEISAGRLDHRLGDDKRTRDSVDNVSLNNNVRENESLCHDPEVSRREMLDSIEIKVKEILVSLNYDISDERVEHVLTLAAAAMDQSGLFSSDDGSPHFEKIEATEWSDYYFTICAQQFSFRKMHVKRPAETVSSTRVELKVVSDRGTIVGWLKSNIPREDTIVYLMTRFVEKYIGTEFDKVKARLLLGGDLLFGEYESRWEEISARTVALASLFACVGIMAFEGMDTACMDFKSAFLYAWLAEEDQCWARLPPEESQILIDIDPIKWAPFLNDDGCIYVKVVGALYGHPKAPILWYQYLKEKLGLISFYPLSSDCCLFTRSVSGYRTISALWVDDVFIGTKEPGLFPVLQSFLDDHFGGEGKLDIGSTLNYLNMMFQFDKDDRSVIITQEGYWSRICEKFGLVSTDVAVMPHRSDVMDRIRNRNTEEVGSSTQRKKFLSLIMSLLWGAQRTQPSLLADITILASQSKYGTEADYRDGLQVLKHINGRKKMGIRLKFHDVSRLSVFVDSSCNLHPDMRGHGGYVISIGGSGYGGPVETSSFRASVNGRSAMDYELYSSHDMLPSLLFLREVMIDLGYPQEASLIFEDNKALIDVFKRGKISTGATKHLAAKYFYSTDLQQRKIIEYRHCPTLLMIADILTKLLGGPRFHQLDMRLRNYDEQNDSMTNDIYHKLYRNSTSDVYHDDDAELVKILILLYSKLVKS